MTTSDLIIQAMIKDRANDRIEQEAQRRWRFCPICGSDSRKHPIKSWECYLACSEEQDYARSEG